MKRLAFTAKVKPPGAESLHFSNVSIAGSFVEAVIDLYRVEVPGVKLKHVTRRSTGWIEHRQPMLVVPAGSSYMNGCRHI